MMIGIDATSANKTRRTGIEWYSYALLNAMKAHALQEGERVFLYSRHPLRGRLSHLPAGWEHKELHWPLKRGWMQGRLSLEMLTASPDVLFIPGQALPKLLPRKGATAVTVHDCAFKREPDVYEREMRERLERIHQDYAARADLLYCVSEATAQDMKEFYQVDPSRIRVTPLSLNKNVFQVLPHERIQPVLEMHGLERSFLLSVGRLEAKKNTLTLIKAFEALKGDVDLVLVGFDGFGSREIHSAIINSPKRSQIKLMGYLPTEEIAVLLNAAEAFVFPSKQEGFGIPLLEAMHCGTPVIASDIPAHREVAGEAARLIRPDAIEGFANEIDRVLDDHVLRRECVQRGFSRAEQFSWEKTAALTWEGLRSLL